MRLLLDTQILIWAFEGGGRLTPEARAAIVDGANTVYASAASAWEIAIKKGLGKLNAPDDLPEQLVRHRFIPLPVTVEHALAVERLPAHHSDLFDRLLVAQAGLERATLVTRDSMLRRYGIGTLEG